MKTIAILLVLILVGAQDSSAQSCGAGVATFFFPDSAGARVIPNVRMSLLTASNDQSWFMEPPKDWHELDARETEIAPQILAAVETTKLGYLDRAWQIDEKIYDSLLAQRRTLLTTPINDYVAESDERASTFVEKEDGFPRIRTREGCAWMVVGKFEADGYETGYYVSQFTCGCNKRYVFRLKPLGAGPVVTQKPSS